MTPVPALEHCHLWHCTLLSWTRSRALFLVLLLILHLPWRVVAWESFFREERARPTPCTRTPRPWNGRLGQRGRSPGRRGISGTVHRSLLSLSIVETSLPVLYLTIRCLARTHVRTVVNDRWDQLTATPAAAEFAPWFEDVNPCSSVSPVFRVFMFQIGVFARVPRALSRRCPFKFPSFPAHARTLCPRACVCVYVCRSRAKQRRCQALVFVVSTGSLTTAGLVVVWNFFVFFGLQSVWHVCCPWAACDLSLFPEFA